MRRVQLNTIKGLEHLKDYYYIQEDGKLFTINEREMRESLRANGYIHNTLTHRDGSSISYLRHCLVALAFIPNPENKREVNHINEVKDDNHVSNLEWATRAENCQHGTRTERSAQSRSRPVIGTCVKTGKTIEFPSVNQGGREGFVAQSISACCLGKRNTHKGFTWQFKE